MKTIYLTLLYDFVKEALHLSLFLFICFGITFTWFLFLEGKTTSKRYSENLLSAFCFCIFQLYITNLILSILSFKKVLPFIILNIVVTSVFTPKKNLHKLLNLTLRKIREGFEDLLSPNVIAIASLITFFILYLLIISFFYPPIGTDDFGYRLPVVWENIRNEGFFKLNRNCDPRMAFPQIPYTIFETYIITSGSDRFLDISNLLFLIVGANALYCIARTLGATRQQAFISSSFMFITPVFIGQLKSNYVDLAFASFFLSSFSFQLKVIKQKDHDLIDMLSMSLYTGYLLGTKYTGLMFLPAFEFVTLLSRRYLLLNNTVALAVAAPWYVINAINFGSPIYPSPFSELGKRIYPQGENILNPSVLLHRYVRVFLAFLKYDNLEISYHKGFGLFFWFISLPTFIVFSLKNIREKRAVVFYLLNVFIPLIYLLWSTIPTIHVQGRFLMWFVALTYPFCRLILTKRNADKLMVFLFLIQFGTNFLKMRNQDQPLLHFSPIVDSVRSNPRCTLYDRFFLKYSIWFGYYQKAALMIQLISENHKKPLSISCIHFDEGVIKAPESCPFTFWGPIRNRKMNNFSSCVHLIDTDYADVIVITTRSGEELEQKDTLMNGRYILILSYTGNSPKLGPISYALFIRMELYDEMRKVLSENEDCFLGNSLTSYKTHTEQGESSSK